jgi:hypothetical protein
MSQRDQACMLTEPEHLDKQLAERARRPKARRSSGSAMAAEVFMNNAGW